MLPPPRPTLPQAANPDFTTPPGFTAAPVLPFRTPFRFIGYVRLLRGVPSSSVSLIMVDVAALFFVH